MDQVRMAIYHGLESTGSKNSHSIPRLPIDRVFTLAGFGTVVTGTLLGGQLYSGLNIVIEPGGYAGRIRGLQTHKTKIETAVPGSRVAVNLTGLDKEDIKRGDVLTLPGSIPSTLLCDVSYRHLPKALEPLLHNQEVKFFSGAAEVIARSRVIGAKKINPGEDGWLQLAFQDSVALIRGDHFILRRPSPAATIGGGVILDPHPGRRHRRFKPDVHARFKTLSLGNPAELLMETLRRYEPMAAASLIHRSGLDASDGDSLVHQQLEAGEIIKISQHFYSRSGWQMILGRATSIISTFHEHWPLRIGIPREELRSRLGLENTHFNIMLGEMSENGTVAVKDGKVKLASHEIKLTSNERAKADKVLGSFAKAGVNSPNVKDAKSEAGEDVYNALLELGELVQISSDVVYRTSEYEQIIQLILESLQEKNRLNAAEVRDILGTSRKYAIALLEHLDDIKVTKREGDHRKLIVNVSPARQQKS